MNVLSRIIFVYFVIAIWSISCAVEVENLYEAEMAIAGGIEPDKEGVTRKALQVILRRVLVGENVLEESTVKNVLANAVYYVREFQYSLSEEDINSSRTLRVLFDEKLLVDALRPGKAGIWNEIRPRSLIWLVIEKNGEQQFFDTELMPEVDFAMNKAANEKKLPMLYPIQDLNEKRKLSMSDVLSAYSDHLLEISTRYDVVSTLAGKMIDKGTCWKAQWTHYFDGKIIQWNSPCGALREIASTGFQGVYDTLSNYYAVTPEAKTIHSVLLQISHINSLRERERVTEYLDSLVMSKTVTWVNKDSGYDLYRVFYQGKRSALNNALTKDHILNLEDYSKINASKVKYKLISN